MMPFIPLIGVPSSTRDWVCDRDGHLMSDNGCDYCGSVGAPPEVSVKSWDNRERT